MPASDLQRAVSIFNSKTTLLERTQELEFNIYTEFRKGFPRFQFCYEPKFHVILFSDRHCHLDPLQENIIPRVEHLGTTIYSKEILDTFTADQIAYLPFPRFAPFFLGYVRTYTETSEATAAIAAELLVDGMNLDNQWCKAHCPISESDMLNFALRLVRGKSSRIADFSGNEVTCFISNWEEARKMAEISGFKPWRPSQTLST